jgi:hypothetical protein
MIATAVLATVAAAMQVAPIDVQTCQTGIEVSDMLYKTNGNYRIDFINRDERTADAIIFDIHLGSRDIPIRDEGRFAPGIVVSHRFPNRGGEVILAARPTMECDVIWVHFTDGSEWRP